MYVMRVSERTERKGQKYSKQLMAEVFRDLMTNVNLRIQEAQQASSGINTERHISGPIIVKMFKNKEKILKIGREKATVTY